MTTAGAGIERVHPRCFLLGTARGAFLYASTLRIGWLLLLATLVIQAGCRAGEHRPASPASGSRPNEAPVSRILPGLKLKLEVPEQARIVATVPNVVQVELLPGGRSPRTLSFSRRNATSDLEPRNDRTLSLASGLTLRYRVTQAQGAGSGGSQLLLTGQLELGGGVIAITCDDQTEWPQQPNLDWCLKLLVTLSPA